MIHEVRVFFALNVGEGVNLERCRHLLDSAQDSGFKLVPQQSVRFKGGLHPLRVVVCDSEAKPIALGEWTLTNTVRLTLYELGLCSVEFRIETKAELKDLVPLSTVLWQNPDLSSQARAQTARLLEIVSSAVEAQELSEEPEDYIVFLGKPDWNESTDGQVWLSDNRVVVAQLLNSEPGSLSAQECSIATAASVSYSSRDLAVLDWAAALVIAEDPVEALEVIEFANSVLLNLRELDAQLKEVTDLLAEESSVSTGRWLLRQLFGSYGQLVDISRKHWRFRLILNRLDNPLDLVGDTYLERIYRELASGLRVKGYRSGIEGNLSSLSDLRDRLREEARYIVQRNLELIIVALFLYEVFLQ